MAHRLSKGPSTDQATYSTWVQVPACYQTYREKGRGVALLYKSIMKVTVVTSPQKHSSFEALGTRFSFREGSIHMVSISRSPPSQINRLTAGMLFDEFSDLLERYACVPGDLILTGYFNFYFEDTDDPNTTRLRDILETFNMIPRVQDPTHLHI